MEPIGHELGTQPMHPRVGADDFHGVAPFSPSAPKVTEDGLHVSKLEQGITARHIEDLVAVDGELEVKNAESGRGGGFQRWDDFQRPQEYQCITYS